MSVSTEPVTISVTLLSQLFRYLEALKVDSDAFVRSLGLDPALFRSPDARIPVETYLRIQDEAAVYTADPCFGLHMGEYAEAGSWSILGYVMMNCKTLGEAFEKAGRYSRIIGNMIDARAELGLGNVRLVYFTPPTVPVMSRHCFESTFSSSVRMMRILTGRDLNPLEVTFIYPEPESRGEYARVFRCPVRFGCKDNTMSLAWDLGSIPIPLANPALLARFEQFAQDAMADIDRQNEHTRAVTRIILSRLDDDGLSIDKVARAMAVSVRTLQNRLADEGVVFSDLHREIRHRLARQYLCDQYTVEQITYLLG
ncbi:MAG: AraC family transcriptional regulator, partial [Anaerolineales bacterium]|nr:AraC family transcriptional regulator [Anaerolineales bacterium]